METSVELVKCDIGSCLKATPRTLESQGQNHSQNRRIQVPQTVAYGVFDREFDFDSQEWIGSH